MANRNFASLLFRTFTKWQKNDATLRSAALTFFTIMPLPSLALIAIAVLAQIYGKEQALVTLTTQVSVFAGPAVANLLSEVLLNAQSPLTSTFGSLLAILFAITGALGAFSVLQKSMDIIWEIKSPPRGKAALIKEKVIPFSLIFILAFIVVATTALTTLLFNGLVFWLGGFAAWLIRILEIVLSVGLGTLLFGIIFKMLPETKIEWGDVWLAAAITAVIFTLLNSLFGLYLSLFPISTLAGTAGSLMVLFLWIYLTNLFILFGAQFSKVYTQANGSQVGKRTIPKYPPPPIVEKVEMKAEVNMKFKTGKS